MKKTVFRFFYGFLDAQQNFLNRMAGQGWRLVRTGRILYEFEACPPDAYRYCVDFVGEKSAKASQDYRAFLEEMGYRVFTKPLQINLSFGKVRLRPWGQGWGKIATTPGAFNRELLIVEAKNDGKPFALHTTAEDRIAYYRVLRSSWGFVSFTIAAFAVFFALRHEALWKIIALGLLSALHLWQTWRSHRILTHLKSESEVIES